MITYEAGVTLPTRTDTAADVIPVVTVEAVLVVSVMLEVPATTPVKSHETLPFTSETAVHAE